MLNVQDAFYGLCRELSLFTPCPRVPGYFRKRRFSSPVLKKSAPTRSVFETYFTLHTYYYANTKNAGYSVKYPVTCGRGSSSCLRVYVVSVAVFLPGLVRCLSDITSLVNLTHLMICSSFDHQKWRKLVMQGFQPNVDSFCNAGNSYDRRIFDDQKTVLKNSLCPYGSLATS